jgi:hypothetical protein
MKPRDGISLIVFATQFIILVFKTLGYGFNMVSVPRN